MSVIPARALHYVFKIGDRAKNMFFFRNILGMRVLRHEEFKEGCDAQCNGPYDNRWSKTMIGYGPESSHFVFELTYNYGVKKYELGNDFAGVFIKSKETIQRARSHSYPIAMENNYHVLTTSDGYKFYIIDEPQPKNSDPVTEVALNCTDLVASKAYWHQTLSMSVVCEEENTVLLSYNEKHTGLRIRQINGPLNRATAYGRIAFAVPETVQPKIDQTIQAAGGKILTPLIKLDTPGKASVRVIILADPDGHEICFVDEEGFRELSKEEDDCVARLEKYIGKDPFQDK